MSSELPDRWVTLELKDVAKWGSGGTPKSGNPSYYGGDIPWAVIGDLNDGVVSLTATAITQAGVDNSSAKIVPEGTLLLAMYGSIGKLGITGCSMATNQAIAFARPDEKKVRLKYLFFYLLSQRQKFLKSGKGATQQNISQTLLKPWPIPIAPLDEQAEIVRILEEQFSRLDAAAASIATVRHKADQFRRSLLHAAFTGVLTGQRKFLDNGLTSELRVSDFFDLFEVVSNDKRQVKQREYLKSGLYPVVDQGEELVGGYLDDKSLLFSGDLPVIVFGDHTRRLKFVDFPFIVGADGTKLIRCRNCVLERFGYFHLEATEFRNRGYARHFGELRKEKFWMPSLGVQKEIVKVLEEQLSRLNEGLAIANVIEGRLLSLRRALLHAAFSGELTKEWREKKNG